ncbi:FMRFamide peptide receptor frpr-18-like [Dreissena polymorpha]|uniref:G-protein coupled receptors family 1 profile domain-containing protein n=2 Tax=Dreissena polymorpha TaxID=45954 RepID=A0A9D4MSR0_DREPO|nr:FMRFamide peptide receptor frpr-18-like [Dreissena polymorpha]KAH3877565.1 hypothetical protein DPMN_001440 [Dreissena polymorpha]KAH3881753.1 hypothetical protein DPMN_005680 [Dreissena polymorpha]
MDDVVFVSGSECPYTFDVVEELQGKNVTARDAMAWTCSIRAYWVNILPLVKIVRFLLSYGTALTVIMGVLLNALSFIVLTRKHMRKTTSNLYLSFLAIYDIGTLIFNFMIGVIRGNSEMANKTFQNSESLCTFHGVIVELFSMLSVWIIVSFTVERFLMIKFPFKARTWSPRKTVITLIIVSAVVTLISLHKIAVSGFEGDSVFGYKACKTRRTIFVEIIYVYVALNTWLPTVSIVILNGIMINELRKNKIKRQQMTQTSMTKTDEKATRQLLMISSTFVLLVLPLGIVQSMELIWNGTQTVPPGHVDYEQFIIMKIRLKWVRSFFFFFYQLNFAINFFLYVASSSSTRFRATLRKILGMKQQEQESMFTRPQPKSNAIAPVSAIDDDLDAKPGSSRA